VKQVLVRRGPSRSRRCRPPASNQHGERSALSGLPLYRRALEQPEHVRKALEVARDQGVARTIGRI
jgi:hypothetical protein